MKRIITSLIVFAFVILMAGGSIQATPDISIFDQLMALVEYVPESVYGEHTLKWEIYVNGEKTFFMISACSGDEPGKHKSLILYRNENNAGYDWVTDTGYEVIWGAFRPMSNPIPKKDAEDFAINFLKEIRELGLVNGIKVPPQTGHEVSFHGTPN